MKKDVIIDVDNTAVRFTSEGKISVIDAIRAVSSSEQPRAVWESMKKEHPEILDHCEEYSFSTEDCVPVINSEGWEKLCDALLEYLLHFY
jgi:putative IMPACT (imprinted ancient) family translation regulator